MFENLKHGGWQGRFEYRTLDLLGKENLLSRILTLQIAMEENRLEFFQSLTTMEVVFD